MGEDPSSASGTERSDSAAASRASADAPQAVAPSTPVTPDGRWLGQARDCSCVDSFAHGRDRDLGRDGVCPASERRRGEQLLGEYRVWMREQAENEMLTGEHATDRVVEANDHLRAAAALYAETDVADLDGEALMGTVLALESNQRLFDAVKAKVLAGLVVSGVTEVEAGLGVKRWISSRTHSSDVRVARELNVSSTASRFDAFAEAMGRADVGAEHVAALAAVCNDRTIDALIGLQDELLRFAKFHPYHVFVTHLRRVVRVLDPDGAEPDCGDRDTASVARDLEGHLHVRLEASGHNAVEVEQIINTELDRQYRAAVREQQAAGIPVPSQGVLRARAVIELIRRGAQPNPKASSPVVEALLPISVDCDGNLFGVHTVDGFDLDTVTAAVLICGAQFTPIVVDSSGNPLNMGRHCRLFTADQRKAMVLRDGGCVFPGCDQPPSHCDAHHHLEWENGGLTDTNNGGLLCRRHHGLVHRHDPWVIEHCNVDDLPPDLLVAHQVRAESAGMEPTVDVTVIRSPKDRLFLAQNAIDHRGPAPPRRQTAA